MTKPVALKMDLSEAELSFLWAALDRHEMTLRGAVYALKHGLKPTWSNDMAVCREHLRQAINLKKRVMARLHKFPVKP